MVTWVQVPEERGSEGAFTCTSSTWGVCVPLNATVWFVPLAPSAFLLLSLLLCRNPYGQSVGNHGAGLEHVPRERGEYVYVCACLYHPLPVFVPFAC